MGLFSNRSQITSKCGKKKKVALWAQLSMSLMLLPNFDVFCDLLLHRPMATWNLFVLYHNDKEQNVFFMMMSSTCLSSIRSLIRFNQNACLIQLII